MQARGAGATILLFAAALALASSAIVLLSGGFAAGPVVARDPIRPLLIAAILATIGRVLSPVAFDAGVARLIGSRDRRPARIAATAAFAVLVVSIAWNTRAAGGSDSSCYALQADAFAHGHVTVANPLADLLPDLPPDAFAPAGFIPSPVRPREAVPICGAGLALVMAGASLAGGQRAMFLVVPVFAALAVWLTFVLGRRLDDEVTGTAAAVLLACSPIFLYQAVQPMSDVPASALWLIVAITCARDDHRGAIVAGVAASFAVLTRPNLAIAMLPLLLVPRARMRVALAAIPALAVFAALNSARYGSPWATGYGGAASLFSIRYLPDNLARYPRWLLETETPAVLFAAVGVLRAWRDRAQARLAVAVAVSAIFIVVPYAFYTVFDDWWYLRFLLPAFPALLVFTVKGLLSVSRREWRPGVAVVLCVALGSWYVHVARARQTFDLPALESTFVRLGRYAGTQPSNTVFLAVQHTASIRFHGAHMTLAWDGMPPGALDRTIDTLSSHGFVPLIVVEDAEMQEFRRRFARERNGTLDWPPVAQVSGSTRVRIFDPALR